jgi:two-component system sensor histidine kinase MtrB
VGPTEVRPSHPSRHAPSPSVSRSAPVEGNRLGDSILPGAYLDRTEPTPPVEDVTDLVDPGFFRRLLPRRLRSVHLGLASRTTIALALGALVVSVIVSLLTFVVARSSFVAERRRAAERLAFTNAAEAQQALAGRTGRSVSSVLRSQHRPGSSASLLQSGSATYRSNDATVTLDLVPVELRRRMEVSSRNPRNDTASGWQIARDVRGSRLVIGIRLPSVSATFYEFSSLADLDGSLRNLGRALTLAALASTAGAAVVGRSVSRRVVRPLRNVAVAAGDIASGRLETRLELTGDSDLDPLVTSFNDMAASLQTRIEREARFASDVSHELRTPLTALTAAVELLEGGRDELSERNQRIVDVLGNQSRHFRRLVLDLLEISRFDANAAELVVEVFDLPSFVQQLVVLQDSAAEVDASGLQHPEVRLDKRRVERIVANYLQNAANYANGAVRVELRDAAAVPAEIVSTSTILGPGSEALTGEDSPEPLRRIVIAVEDRGPGIGADDRELLFERFRRGAAHQRGSGVKGTGLGLALVAAHAQLHGGRAWVEERPGGGARFCAELVEP